MQNKKSSLIQFFDELKATPLSDDWKGQLLLSLSHVQRRRSKLPIFYGIVWAGLLGLNLLVLSIQCGDKMKQPSHQRIINLHHIEKAFLSHS